MWYPKKKPPKNQQLLLRSKILHQKKEPPKNQKHLLLSKKRHLKKKQLSYFKMSLCRVRPEKIKMKAMIKMEIKMKCKKQIKLNKKVLNKNKKLP